MQRFPFFIFLLLLKFNRILAGSLSASQQAEQALSNTLLTGYTRSIRPDNEVFIGITASILQIVSIDEKQQIMTSSLFITQCWTDSRLSWTTSTTNYSSDVIMLPVRSIWIPDTMIINSADTSGYLTVNNDYSLASVDSDGDVCMILPALSVRTRCNFFVKNFPFDKQMCSINLTSWGQGINRLRYSDNRSEVIDTRNYNEHPLWRLRTTDIVQIVGEDRVPFEDTYNVVISIQLYLERKALYFMMNGIFACLILNCVTLLSYALPFGSQIGLCMTCFMTYSVYSLNFSNLFPQQSEYIMLITLYFLFSMFYTLVSMAWFIICNHYISKGDMPEGLHAFCGTLQKLFICCFPPKKEENKGKQEQQDSARPDNANQIESIETKANVAAENLEATKEEPKTVPLNTAEITVLAKPKCHFCDRCDSCQADFDKDKTKSKNKKEVEARCSALNYFVFIWLFLFMLISNISIWSIMSQ